MTASNLVFPGDVSVLREGVGYVDYLDSQATGEETEVEELVPELENLARLGSNNQSVTILDISDAPGTLPAASSVRHVAAARRKPSKGLLKKLGRGVAKVTRAILHIGPSGSAHSGRCLEKARDPVKARSLAEKVRAFIKEHKKALIIGAIVAAVVIAVIILAPEVPAIGGLVAPAGGAAVPKEEKKKPEPPPVAEAAASGAGTAPPMTLREETQNEAMKQAAVKAMQERFPGLMHSVESIEARRSEADAAFNHFASDLMDKVDSKTAGDVISAGAAVVAAKKTSGIPGIAAQLMAIKEVMALVEKAGDTIVTTYEPIGIAYQHLHRMEAENREASLARCKETGYTPHLIPHPSGPQIDSDHMAFLDANNPTSIAPIIVVMPEDDSLA